MNLKVISDLNAAPLRHAQANGTAWNALECIESEPQAIFHHLPSGLANQGGAG